MKNEPQKPPILSRNLEVLMKQRDGGKRAPTMLYFLLSDSQHCISVFPHALKDISPLPHRHDNGLFPKYRDRHSDPSAHWVRIASCDVQQKFGPLHQHQHLDGSSTLHICTASHVLVGARHEAPKSAFLNGTGTNLVQSYSSQVTTTLFMSPWALEQQKPRGLEVNP